MVKIFWRQANENCYFLFAIFAFLNYVWKQNWKFESTLFMYFYFFFGTSRKLNCIFRWLMNSNCFICLLLQYLEMVKIFWRQANENCYFPYNDFAFLNYVWKQNWKTESTLFLYFYFFFAISVKLNSIFRGIKYSNCFISNDMMFFYVLIYPYRTTLSTTLLIIYWISLYPLKGLIDITNFPTSSVLNICNASLCIFFITYLDGLYVNLLYDITLPMSSTNGRLRRKVILSGKESSGTRIKEALLATSSKNNVLPQSKLGQPAADSFKKGDHSSSAGLTRELE